MHMRPDLNTNHTAVFKDFTSLTLGACTSEGYSSWFVCVSVHLSVLNLLLQGLEQPGTIRTCFYECKD